jgi:hypothetical protein
VFGLEGAPWQWQRPDHFSDWLVAPIAAVELTVWHIIDPVTEQDCSIG